MRARKDLTMRERTRSPDQARKEASLVSVSIAARWIQVVDAHWAILRRMTGKENRLEPDG